MAKDLGKRDQIILVVFQKPLCHGVAKKVRMNLHADESGIFVAEPPDARLGQGSTASKEDPVGG